MSSIFDADFLNDVNELIGQPTEEVVEEVTPEVEEPSEEVEEIVEDEAVTAAPVPVEYIPAPVENTEVPTALEYLYEKFKDKGITKSQLEESMSDLLPVLDEIFEDKKNLIKTIKNYENIPAIQEQKIIDEVAEMYNTNQAEWEDELQEIIPDAWKLLPKLGKKKTEELSEYLTKDVGDFMKNRLRQGKKISNPLLAFAPKIAKKIKELSGIQTTTKKPEAPKQDPKKLMSLNSAEQQEITKETAIPRGMAPGTHQFLQNMDKLFSDI